MRASLQGPRSEGRPSAAPPASARLMQFLAQTAVPGHKTRVLGDQGTPASLQKWGLRPPAPIV